MPCWIIYCLTSHQDTALFFLCPFASSSMTWHLLPSCLAAEVSPEHSLGSVEGWESVNAPVCCSCCGSADWQEHCLGEMFIPWLIRDLVLKTCALPVCCFSSGIDMALGELCWFSKVSPLRAVKATLISLLSRKRFKLPFARKLSFAEWGCCEWLLQEDL